MSTRTAIALVLSMIVSAVLFGIGATTVLSFEPFAQKAATLLPVVIVLSFTLAPMLAWKIAPSLCAARSRQDQLKRRLLAERAGRRSERDYS